MGGPRLSDIKAPVDRSLMLFAGVMESAMANTHLQVFDSTLQRTNLLAEAA
jgi:hypothetical protein